MTYRIFPTKTFEKNLRKLTPPEQRAVAKKLELMMNDPFYPSLRTKKVQGFQDIFECSVNMEIRILWQYRGTDLIITLDIGRHTLFNKL